MPDELPDAVHAQIEALSERGNIARDAGQTDTAIAAWEEALALVPQPQAIWDAALWLHASIADALRAEGDLVAALQRFEAAARCADGATNPFVLLGLGACCGGATWRRFLGEIYAAIDDPGPCRRTWARPCCRQRSICNLS